MRARPLCGSAFRGRAKAPAWQSSSARPWSFDRMESCSMKSNRGFTTLELMVATAITMVAIVAVCTLLIESGHFTRNNEEIIKSNDGVWINNAGTPKLISPIFGTDAIAAEGNTDDIWMVLPDRRAFKESNCALNS